MTSLRRLPGFYKFLANALHRAQIESHLLAKLATEREALVQKILKEHGKQSQGELETSLLPALHSQTAGHGVEWTKAIANP